MESVKNLILICGDEEYLKTEKKKELLAWLDCEGSPDFHTFSGEDTDFAEVMDLAETMPMFSERRVLLLDDTGLFRSGADFPYLDRLKELPPSTTVIFFEYEKKKKNSGGTEKTGGEPADVSSDRGEASADQDAGEEKPRRQGKSSLLKYLETEGTVFRYDQVESIKGRDQILKNKDEIQAWIKRYLAEAGKKVDSRAVHELVEFSGFNMMNLQTELEKLISCNDDPITVATVHTICSRTIPEKVFDMINQKLSGNTAGALSMFEDLLAVRVTPMAVLTIMGKQFLTAYTIKDLESRRMQDREICSELGLTDWQLRNFQKYTRSRSASDLLYFSTLCSDMDAKIKSGDMPDRIAVEIILCS